MVQAGSGIQPVRQAATSNACHCYIQLFVALLFILSSPALADA